MKKIALPPEHEEENEVPQEGETFGFLVANAVTKFSHQSFTLTTTCVAVFAYLSEQQEEDSSSSSSSLLSERSASVSVVLSGTWVVLYVLVVRLLLSQQISAIADFARDVVAKSTSSSSSALLTRVSSSKKVLARIGSKLSSTRLLGFRDDSDDNGQLSSSPSRSSISSKHPFLPLDDISKLSLTDIGYIFYYSTAVCEPTFQRSAFLAGLREPTKKAIYAVDRVVADTLCGGDGDGLSPTPFVEEREGTDICAIRFAGAVRLYAEWRYLFLTGSSSRGFSFFMGIARVDLVKNASKIVHDGTLASWASWIARTGTDKRRSRSSPTIRQLLKHEISNLNLHPRRPFLRGESTASGVLWAVRQIRYQHALLENSLHIPMRYRSHTEAARAAYSIYEPFHGLLTRQIFIRSIDSAPDTLEALQQWHTSSVGGDSSSCEVTTSQDDYFHIPIDECAHTPPLATEADVLGQTWNQVLQQVSRFHIFMGQCSGVGSRSHSSQNVLQHAQSDDESPRSRAVTDAVLSHLSLMGPVTSVLENMIRTYNIDDPSKV